MGCLVGVISPQIRSLRQFPVSLLGPYGLTAEDDEGVPTLRFHSVSLFPKLPRLQVWQWNRYGRRLFSEYVTRFGKPDLVHAHCLYPAGSFAYSLRELHGIPFVVTEHRSAYGHSRIDPHLLRVARHTARAAARTFAVSPAMCSLLETLLGSETSKWRPLPNIVSDRFLKAPLPTVKDRTNGEVVFLHVSLLTPNKAVDSLIRGFAQAFPDDAGARLQIGGAGPEQPRLQALVAALGLSNRVEFLGNLSRDQVLTVMASADAFVLTSRFEPFGVVLIEALALGKPVIATRSGGPESIVGEHDGLLVPVDDVPAIAHALGELRRRIGSYDPAAIRARCESRFSARVVNARLIQEYRDVLASQTRPTAAASR